MIPEGWANVELEEVAEINPKRKNGISDDIPVSFIGMADISESARVIQIHSKKYKEVSKGFTSFADDDILVAKITPCFENGKGALVSELENGIGFGSTEFHVIRATKVSYSKFIFYHTIESEFRRIGETNMTGSAGQRRIPADYLKKYNFLLPPLPEQKKIAAILSSVDNAIQSTQKVIDQTQKVKQGLLQELLTKGIGHTEFKMTEIGEIPKSWDVRRIGECCEICNSLRKPINLEIRKTMKGNYPYYGPTGIIDFINEYRADGEYALIGEDGDHFLKFRSWSMTQYIHGKFNVNNHAHLLKGIGSCSTKWVYHFFEHRDILNYLTRQGAGRYKLNKATLIELPIALPPLYEQKKISDSISSVNYMIAKNIKKISQLKVIKKGLMQDLLTGKKRVKT